MGARSELRRRVSLIALMDAIVVEGLRKRYGKTSHSMVSHLQSRLAQVTGFLGPNGAGKTTTFRSILGLTRPDAGAMEVLGMSVATSLPKIVKRLGVIVEEPGLISGLSGRNNLKVAARTLGRGKKSSR